MKHNYDKGVYKGIMNAGVPSLFNYRDTIPNVERNDIGVMNTSMNDLGDRMSEDDGTYMPSKKVQRQKAAEIVNDTMSADATPWYMPIFGDRPAWETLFTGGSIVVAMVIIYTLMKKED